MNALLFNPGDLRDRLYRGRDGDVFPAVIFSAPAGMGKSLLALWWAQALNCRQKQDAAPCGTCRVCRLFAERHHPDLTIVAPAEDAASVKIEQVRAMQEKLSFAPLEAAYRLVLIDAAETLTESAANCLLKTLEEPPDRNVFVLSTTNHFRLPITVLSRCRLFKLLPLEPDRLSGWLQEVHGQAPERADLLARLAQGCPGRAVSRAGDARWWNARDFVLDCLRQLAGRQVGPADGLDLVEKAAAGTQKVAAMRFLEISATWFRDLGLLAAGVDATAVINVDRVGDLRTLAEPAAGEDRWLQALQGVAVARRLLEANANPRLVLQWLALHLLEGTPVPEDMARA